MIIKSLTLYTQDLDQQKAFYQNILGFSFLEESQQHFSLQTGDTTLLFKKSKHQYHYHYCFLIPSNKLEEAIHWLQKRLELVKDENGNIVQYFESWNAHAVYFWDGSGNLVEFIVRHDLKNEMDDIFDRSQIINVNEIGIPTNDAEKMNVLLESQLNSKLWKGDLKRFATNGTQEGLFLLVNNEVKKTWFPTALTTQSSPFDAVVEVEGKLFNLAFKNQEIHIMT